MSDLGEYVRFWPYGVAVLAGVVFAVVDRRIGRFVFGALLVLVVAGGGLGTYLSPFTFHGGDYYMESLIAMLFALAALAGYALTQLAGFLCARACCGGKA